MINAVNNTTDNGNLIARPVTIMHQDGTQETVYLMQVPSNGKKKVTDQVREHAIMFYFLIGTLALSLSIILSYRQLKKG